MPIISFWNKEKIETGKTFSLVALATYMALKNNMKILITYYLILLHNIK